MIVKPGQRLAGIGGAELIVTRAPAEQVELTCAGAGVVDMAAGGGPPDASPPDAASELLLGKRYHDERSGLELLCTKPGAGPITCDGRVLELVAPKPLPATD